MLRTGNLRLDVYLAWVDAWLSNPRVDRYGAGSIMSIDEMVSFFRDENLLALFKKHENLKRIISSFHFRVDSGEILLGGETAPSCNQTNILRQRYDPRVECNCNGVYPVPPEATAESLLERNECAAVKRMVELASLVNEKENEWNPRQIFTAKDLHTAVAEFVLSNADEQPLPDSCLGPTSFLSDIQAPDRRPNPACDTEPSVYHQLYPTNERIKLLADAKHFFAIACGGGFCDEVLAKAVSEAANGILIADYCEAADDKSISLLQEVALQSRRIGHHWQFDNNVALLIQFQILGYYRDHSRPRRPHGAYGSRMTSMLSHRYIDLAIYVGVMNASIGLGKQITREEYQLLAEACCYINDLIDFRSDTMRRLRENVILRGIRGNLCEYLDGLFSSCWRLSAKAIRSSSVSALVVMGISNWMLMASQHKVYEVFHGVQEREGASMCEYTSTSDGSYQELLDALSEYGTLGEDGPNVTKRRSEMDLLYHAYRKQSQTHTAWLADSTRSLLNPVSLRKIVDVVHFEWKGQTGDVEYCP
ncbi:hypothetical protein FQN54_004149 [Arachnomyces sp. PD_36]|nr:hypothetical protein FQN54_004149 [Arachnomyces sp. PD_36]